jgi:hypothetical protein
MLEHDATQGGFAGIPNADSSDAVLVRRSPGVNLASVPGTRHYYNNINYALLGLVIHEVTGETYEAYCRRMALAPAWSAWCAHGLRRPGEGRVRRLGNLRHRVRAIRACVRPAPAPAQPAGGSVHQHRQRQPLLRTRGARGAHRSRAQRVPFRRLARDDAEGDGALLRHVDNGISVVATYDRSLPETARTALDTALYNAAHEK